MFSYPQRNWYHYTLHLSALPNLLVIPFDIALSSDHAVCLSGRGAPGSSVHGISSTGVDVRGLLQLDAGLRATVRGVVSLIAVAGLLVFNRRLVRRGIGVVVGLVGAVPRTSHPAGSIHRGHA